MKKLFFPCGGMLRVEKTSQEHLTASVPVDDGEGRKRKLRKSEIRNGFLRVVVWCSKPLENEQFPVLPTGERAPCIFKCPCTRAASGRKEYEVFPDDYEAEKEGKYKDKRFSEIRQRVIACFPYAAREEIR